MVDMNNPAPWIMTGFESTGFVSGVIAVVATIIWDFVRRRGGRSGPPKI